MFVADDGHIKSERRVVVAAGFCATTCVCESRSIRTNERKVLCRSASCITPKPQDELSETSSRAVLLRYVTYTQLLSLLGIHYGRACHDVEDNEAWGWMSAIASSPSPPATSLPTSFPCFTISLFSILLMFSQFTETPRYDEPEDH